MLCNTRICTKCNETKLLDDFVKKNNIPTPRCKLCTAKYKSSYYLANLDNISKKHKLYYNKNKEKINLVGREYYKNNRQSVARKCREYREANGLKIKDLKKKYRNENIERIRESNRQYYERNKSNKDFIEKRKIYRTNNKSNKSLKERLREKEDVSYKLTNILRKRFCRAFKCGYKNGSAIRNLGCSIEYFKKYIENKFYLNKETNEMMTWENYGLTGWHIDHILPLASFDLRDEAQLKKACHYTNLQPLWAKENLSKGAKITGV